MNHKDTTLAEIRQHKGSNVIFKCHIHVLLQERYRGGLFTERENRTVVSGGWEEDTGSQCLTSRDSVILGVRKLTEQVTTCTPRTRETEARFLWIQGQLGLHNLSYSIRPCLKRHTRRVTPQVNVLNTTEARTSKSRWWNSMSYVFTTIVFLQISS